MTEQEAARPKSWVDKLGVEFLEHLNIDEEIRELIDRRVSPFVTACALSLKNPGTTLCHGFPLGQKDEIKGMRFTHAWLEKRLVIPLPEGARQNIDAAYKSGDQEAMTVSMALDVYAPTIETGWMPIQLYYFALGIEAKHIRKYPELLRTYTAGGNDGDYGPWEEPPEEYRDELIRTAKFVNSGGTLTLTLPEEIVGEE